MFIRKNPSFRNKRWISVYNMNAYAKSYVQEVLFELFPWHICRVVIMQVMIDTGDVLHVVKHFGDVVTHDDDGALLVDLLQHLVHLLLESAVDVGVWLIEDNDIWL